MATTVGNVVFSISADLKSLQGQLRTMEGNFQSSFGRIEGLAKSFSTGLFQGLAAGFSVAGVTQFGKEILNLADSLQNLHEQTQVSVEVLSGIKSTLEENGTSLDTFAKGIFNLQKNLGNIDKETDPAAQAIKRLGLNLTELRNISPDEFIKKVTDALGQIENPLERNTVMFNLLGKSAKELGPALAALAGHFDELKRSGLSAADVKALDDVGDALTRLKNQALLLGAEGVAGLLRFFGVLRDGPKVAAQLADATAKFSQLSGIPQPRVEGMTSKEIIAAGEKPGFGINPEALRQARDGVLNLREEFNRLNSVNIVKPQAAFKGISAAAKTAKNDVDNFLEGLQKQLGTFENKKIELTLGPDAALTDKLNRDFEDFKEKLKEKNLPVPKGLAEFFANLRDRIVDSGKAVRDLNDSLEESVKIQQAFADAANEGVGVTTLDRESVARQKAAIDQLNDLRRQLSIDTIDTSTPQGAENKRIASILADYETTYKKIQELALQAGLTNEQSAQLTADAWQKAALEINSKVDEVTEFQRRAMERAFDAMTDLGKDALGGQIKSWSEFGNRVKKVIDEIVAEWLSMQLKIAVLGENFGGKSGGGQIGGLLGSVLGFFGIKQAAPSAWAGLNPAQVLAREYHTGGIVGQAGRLRAVDASVFAYAPRYHDGWAPGLKMGERPAILQDGEAVIPRGGWRRGGDGGITIINNNPNFADRRSQAQILAAMGAQVKNANRNM